MNSRELEFAELEMDCDLDEVLEVLYEEVPLLVRSAMPKFGQSLKFLMSSPLRARCAPPSYSEREECETRTCPPSALCRSFAGDCVRDGSCHSDLELSRLWHSEGALLDGNVEEGVVFEHDSGGPMSRLSLLDRSALFEMSRVPSDLWRDLVQLYLSASSEEVLEEVEATMEWLLVQLLQPRATLLCRASACCMLSILLRAQRRSGKMCVEALKRVVLAVHEAACCSTWSLLDSAFSSLAFVWLTAEVALCARLPMSTVLLLTGRVLSAYKCGAALAFESQHAAQLWMDVVYHWFCAEECEVQSKSECAWREGWLEVCMLLRHCLDLHALSIHASRPHLAMTWRCLRNVAVCYRDVIGINAGYLDARSEFENDSRKLALNLASHALLHSAPTRWHDKQALFTTIAALLCIASLMRPTGSCNAPTMEQEEATDPHLETQEDESNLQEDEDDLEEDDSDLEEESDLDQESDLEDDESEYACTSDDEKEYEIVIGEEEVALEEEEEEEEWYSPDVRLERAIRLSRQEVKDSEDDDEEAVTTSDWTSITPHDYEEGGEAQGDDADDSDDPPSSQSRVGLVCNVDWSQEEMKEALDASEKRSEDDDDKENLNANDFDRELDIDELPVLIVVDEEDLPCLEEEESLIEHETSPDSFFEETDPILDVDSVPRRQESHDRARRPSLKEMMAQEASEAMTLAHVHVLLECLVPRGISSAERALASVAVEALRALIGCSETVLDFSVRLGAVPSFSCLLLLSRMLPQWLDEAVVLQLEWLLRRVEARHAQELDLPRHARLALMPDTTLRQLTSELMDMCASATLDATRSGRAWIAHGAAESFTHQFWPANTAALLMRTLALVQPLGMGARAFELFTITMLRLCLCADARAFSQQAISALHSALWTDAPLPPLHKVILSAPAEVFWWYTREGMETHAAREATFHYLDLITNANTSATNKANGITMMEHETSASAPTLPTYHRIKFSEP